MVELFVDIDRSETIERQLAHMENNGARRAYTRGEYCDERARMMRHWSDRPIISAMAKVLKPNFGARRG